MCRNIKTLYNFEPPATKDEIRAAALQYVRKISGFAKPSAANETAYDRAVDEVAKTSSTLLRSLVTSASPRDREVEAAKAHCPRYSQVWIVAENAGPPIFEAARANPVENLKTPDGRPALARDILRLLGSWRVRHFPFRFSGASAIIGQIPIRRNTP